MTSRKADSQKFKRGTISKIDGVKCIFIDGYWIRYYAPPAESWEAKKNLIAGLTRRTFHHTERGINTPGGNLELARHHYENTTVAEEKRVAAAMLAGALFNRATDIFTTIADLEDIGVHIDPGNELLQECSECLEEAMELGKSVRHISGNEGINELWGEPLKAFTMSGYDFYISRYVKISLTMRDMDRINVVLKETLKPFREFDPVISAMFKFSRYAKRNCETMKRDPLYFKVWPKFVTRSDRVSQLLEEIKDDNSLNTKPFIIEACELVSECRELITYISAARVPMSKLTNRFFDTCNAFQQKIKSA